MRGIVFDVRCTVLEASVHSKEEGLNVCSECYSMYKQRSRPREGKSCVLSRNRSIPAINRVVFTKGKQDNGKARSEC